MRKGKNSTYKIKCSKRTWNNCPDIWECGYEVHEMILLQALPLYCICSLQREVIFRALPLSRYALSRTMQPLLEISLELLLWNICQCSLHSFLMSSISWNLRPFKADFIFGNRDWLWAGWSGFRISLPGGGPLGIFLFCTASRPVLVATQLPTHWAPGALSPEVKRLAHEANYLPPSSAEVNECVALYLQHPIRLHGVVLS
jgi:hypothetical protein